MQITGITIISKKLGIWVNSWVYPNGYTQGQCPGLAINYLLWLNSASVAQEKACILSYFFCPVDRFFFFSFPRFDIFVDGYNSLDRNIISLLSTIPSP